MLTPISNEPRDYSWGSTTLIAGLEGRPPTGAPEAEIWYGDHPGCPSRTPDGRTLDVALAEAGRPPLPFLLKLLAAASSLSIQAHPTRDQAREGFAREEGAGVPRDAAERLYRDDNHKPEIIVALSERFRALVGLRPLAETRRLLDALDAPSASGAVAEIRERLGDADTGVDARSALRGTLAWALDEADAVAVVNAGRDDEFARLQKSPEFLGACGHADGSPDRKFQMSGRLSPSRWSKRFRAARRMCERMRDSARCGSRAFMARRICQCSVNACSLRSGTAPEMRR